MTFDGLGFHAGVERFRRDLPRPKSLTIMTFLGVRLLSRAYRGGFCAGWVQRLSSR